MGLLLFGVIGMDSVIVATIWYVLYRFCYHFTKMKWGLDEGAVISFGYLKYIESKNRSRKLAAAVISGILVLIICVIMRFAISDAISDAIADL